MVVEFRRLPDFLDEVVDALESGVELPREPAKGVLNRLIDAGDNIVGGNRRRPFVRAAARRVDFRKEFSKGVSHLFIDLRKLIICQCHRCRRHLACRPAMRMRPPAWAGEAEYHARNYCEQHYVRHGEEECTSMQPAAQQRGAEQPQSCPISHS